MQLLLTTTGLIEKGTKCHKVSFDNSGTKDALQLKQKEEYLLSCSASFASDKTTQKHIGENDSKRAVEGTVQYIRYPIFCQDNQTLHKYT